MNPTEITQHLEIVDHVRAKADKPKAIIYADMARELFHLALTEISQGQESEPIIRQAREQFHRAVYLVYRS